MIDNRFTDELKKHAGHDIEIIHHDQNDPCYTTCICNDCRVILFDTRNSVHDYFPDVAPPALEDGQQAALLNNLGALLDYAASWINYDYNDILQAAMKRHEDQKKGESVADPSDSGPSKDRLQEMDTLIACVSSQIGLHVIS